mmetsp:Transcript_15448/g.27971  ORF Transcript_15448/g.27971 Transcript_15448/m.27971 type:complete len:108 (+) Transcript_15448:1750-2073(+)
MKMNYGQLFLHYVEKYKKTKIVFTGLAGGVLLFTSLTMLPDSGSVIQRKCKEVSARGFIQLNYLKALAFETPARWTKLTEVVDNYTTSQDNDVKSNTEASLSAAYSS